MGLFSVLLFGVGLSADAAGVAVCEGMKLKRGNLRLALKIAFFFGFFQMLMPALGFCLGDAMVRIPLLEGAVGWIAFALLFFVAAKMLIEAVREAKEGEGGCPCDKPQATTRELFLLAIATSIDALTVGVTFAAQPPALLAAGVVPNVLLSAALIGCVTFTLSFAATLFGRAVGRLVGSKAEIVGGGVLLLLSVKILLENLGVSIHF